MARLSVLAKDQLTPEFADLTEQAAAGGQATVFQVLGHRPDMFQSYFQFYYPAHDRGVVSSALKELVRLKVAQLNNCFT